MLQPTGIGIQPPEPQPHCILLLDLVSLFPKMKITIVAPRTMLKYDLFQKGLLYGQFAGKSIARALKVHLHSQFLTSQIIIFMSYNFKTIFYSRLFVKKDKCSYFTILNGWEG